MTDKTKPLTMQDLIEQNARLEKVVTGMANVIEDLVIAFDRENCQIWEHILSRK